MVDDFTWKVMEKDLEGLTKRFRATSKNLANANTPFYARHNVSFEDELRDVIAARNDKNMVKMTITDSGHIPTRPHSVSDVTPDEFRLTDEVYRLDGNNVDPEREMSVLAETRMMYTAITRFAQKKLNGYRTVISGR